MNHEMPILSYANNALEPVISGRTIDFHYGKHLQTYVSNLNRLIQNTSFENMTVEKIIEEAPEGGIFNNAGQVLNHTLYFQQFKPVLNDSTENLPSGRLLDAIIRNFGSFENFKSEMNTKATTLFGSGWLWLTQDQTTGNLQLVSCFNGDNPLRIKQTPLLGFDVWEHAYYLDYQNRRADYLESLWKIIDWKIVTERM